MIIDAHIHIFPDEVVAGRERFFADEPEFKILYNNPKARLANTNNALEMLEREGVTAAVVCGFPWRVAANFKRHNDFLANLRAQYPNKFAALGAFHTANPQAFNEARRCLELKLNGLGELAFYNQPLNDDALNQMAPLMALYAEAGLPVMLHANEPIGHLYPGKATAEISAYYNFCRKFAHNKIILAHWGGGLAFYRLLKREVKDALQNVWFDTAASPYLYDDEVYRLGAEAAGCDRILFGSDYPLLPPGRYIKAITASGLSQNAQKSVLGENAKNLFNFNGIK